MLEPSELDYIKRNLRKARREQEALPRVLDHVELLVDHIIAVESERNVLRKALELAAKDVRYYGKYPEPAQAHGEPRDGDYYVRKART